MREKPSLECTIALHACASHAAIHLHGQQGKYESDSYSAWEKHHFKVKARFHKYLLDFMLKSLLRSRVSFINEPPLAQT